MAIEVYLIFNGNCREAIEFYKEAFNTEPPQIMTFGESPQNPDYPLPDEAKDLIMHAKLTISGNTVMFSDTFPNSTVEVGSNISLALVSKDIHEIKTAYEKLKEDGKIGMELQETFWSKCYGQVTDKFGVTWQLSYEEGKKI
ncbi:VOC family protein [Metabacillus malikii]|uniref:PhnB protein n=1 Tax=Metabacillus malikii TaxID=1504265 RepID=A0ABT9ZFJ8_9BACI|nr:VOC family protein [Metabacillus malikii]MDQ0230343.1 PhnB protein [Metabacillus malikii]